MPPKASAFSVSNSAFTVQALPPIFTTTSAQARPSALVAGCGKVSSKLPQLAEATEARRLKGSAPMRASQTGAKEMKTTKRNELQMPHP